MYIFSSIHKSRKSLTSGSTRATTLGRHTFKLARIFEFKYLLYSPQRNTTSTDSISSLGGQIIIWALHLGRYSVTRWFAFKIWFWTLSAGMSPDDTSQTLIKWTWLRRRLRSQCHRTNGLFSLSNTAATVVAASDHHHQHHNNKAGQTTAAATFNCANNNDALNYSLVLQMHVATAIWASMSVYSFGGHAEH